MKAHVERFVLFWLILANMVIWFFYIPTSYKMLVLEVPAFIIIAASAVLLVAFIMCAIWDLTE
jgi:hypothetical protein